MESLKIELMSYEAIRAVVQYYLQTASNNINDICFLNSMFSYLVGTGEYTDLIVDMIKDKRIDPSSNDNILIKNATDNGFSHIICILLGDERVNPFINNNYVLKKSIKCNYNDVIKKILRHPNFQINDNSNVFLTACKYGNLDSISLLFAYYDPSYNNNEGIISIIESIKNIDKNKIISLLLENNKILDTIDDIQVLKIASKYGLINIIEKILNKHIISVSNSDINDCIIFAIENDNSNVVELFLHMKNCVSDEAICCAVANNNLPIVKLLIKYLPDSHSSLQTYSIKLMHLAIENNNIDIIKLLLEDSRINKYSGLFIAQEKNLSEIFNIIREKINLENGQILADNDCAIDIVSTKQNETILADIHQVNSSSISILTDINQHNTDTDYDTYTDSIDKNQNQQIITKHDCDEDSTRAMMTTTTISTITTATITRREQKNDMVKSLDTIMNDLMNIMNKYTIKSISLDNIPNCEKNEEILSCKKITMTIVSDAN